MECALILVYFVFSGDQLLCLQNFEAAVQVNVLVKGQPWDEAPDVEGDSSSLSHFKTSFKGQMTLNQSSVVLNSTLFN